MTKNSENFMQAPKLPKMISDVKTFKFKDKQNRRGFVYSNAKNPYMAIHKIELRKVPGENNKIEMRVLLPDPDRVEVTLK